jgi:amino acid adenylation domain-containing protein
VATPDGDALVFTFHHMVLDGFSVTSLMTEFQGAYAKMDPVETSGTFADFVSWQQATDEAALHEYWCRRLSTVERPTGTPLAAGEPTRAAGIIGAEALLPLGREEWRRMESAASRHHVTVSTLVHGAWALVLGHYLGTGTVTIGSTESGRTTVPAALRRTRGLMLNTFPFVVELAWDMPAGEWLRTLHAAYRSDVERAGYPLAKIQAIARPLLPPGRRLFESLITFERFPWMPDAAPGPDAALRVTDVTLHEVPEFPLLLEVVAGGVPKVVCRYDRSILRPDDAAALMGALHVAMRELMDGGDRPLRELRVLEDEAAATHRWRAGPARGAAEDFVHRLDRTVAARPDAVAVRAQDGTELTYRQLWRRAGSVARMLAERGHGAGATIALLADRRCDALAAIVGILRAGCTYLPLETDLPPARLELMLRTGNSSCLLVMDATVDVTGVEAVALTGPLPEADFARVAIDAEACAYVIFTSGSTGEPKATEVPHRALAAFLDACADEFGVAAGDVFLAATAYTFDISLLELLYPLVSGATVALIDRTTVRDAHQMIDALRDLRPHWMQATPSFYRMLLAAGWRGSDDLSLLCGGEAITRGLADSLLDRCLRAWNCYGPTETTIWSSFHEVTLHRDELAERGTVSLGRPALGEQLHVLAPNGAPTPPGGVGELCISGAGLALGYRGRPDLTAEVFADSPWGRIYRTGDYVRTSRTGTALEFVGRRDRQLKVRGYRLELQEIERALLDQPAITEAVAMPSADGGGVVAAVVIRETGTAEGELLGQLRSRLPAYLVPAVLVILDAIPRLPSGKTDRPGLLAAVGARATVAAVQPRTETEAAVQAIWSDVLEVQAPSVIASLFDLGGHSLLANLIVSRIEDHFGVRVSVAALFERPTIEATARLVDAEQAERITEDPELARLLAELEAEVP